MLANVYLVVVNDIKIKFDNGTKNSNSNKTTPCANIFPTLTIDK